MSEKINNNLDSNEESTMKTWPDGTKRWCDNQGRYHRLDGPAVEWAHGSKDWYVHGQYHRLDGPAVEWADGSRQWWIHGELHRVDGHAIEREEDGSKSWYVHNKFIVRLVPKKRSQLHPFV